MHIPEPSDLTLAQDPSEPQALPAKLGAFGLQRVAGAAEISRGPSVPGTTKHETEINSHTYYPPR